MTLHYVFLFAISISVWFLITMCSIGRVKFVNDWGDKKVVEIYEIKIGKRKYNKEQIIAKGIGYLAELKDQLVDNLLNL